MRILRMLFLTILLLPSMVLACPVCDSTEGDLVREGIFGGGFFLKFLVLILPFVLVLTLVVPVIKESTFDKNGSVPRSFLRAGMVLGTGVGAFLNGIFLRQIFQTDNVFSGILSSDSLVNAQVNLFWDGITQLVSAVVAVSGIYLLLQASRGTSLRRPPGIFLGVMIFGWGAYSLLEGLVIHQVFGFHHVNERLAGTPQLFYDGLYLVFALGLMLLGRSVLNRTDQNSRDVAESGAIYPELG